MDSLLQQNAELEVISSDTILPNSSFFSCLCDYFKDLECKEMFRATSQGLFVREDVVERLLDAYQQWLSKKTESLSEKSTEKCKRRIFGTPQPKLYYLIDGKMCLVGYLSPHVTNSQQSPLPKKIPFSQSSLIDTASYLHPKDTIFGSIPHVTSVLDPSKGFLLKFESKKRVFWATTDTVKQFARYASQKSLISNLTLHKDTPLRDYIEPLLSCVVKSRVVPDKHKLLIPSFVKGDKKPSKVIKGAEKSAGIVDTSASYYRFRDVVFIVNAESKIDHCYCVDGKSLSVFVRSELSACESKFRALIEPTRKPNPRAIGALSVNKKYYIVYMKAFLKFLTDAPKTPPFKKKIPMYYSVIDCMEQFVFMARSMKKINTRITLMDKSGDRKEGVQIDKKNSDTLIELWRSGLWTLTIANGNQIIDAKFSPRKSSKQRNHSNKTNNERFKKDGSSGKTN